MRFQVRALGAEGNVTEVSLEARDALLYGIGGKVLVENEVLARRAQLCKGALVGHKLILKRLVRVDLALW